MESEVVLKQDLEIKVPVLVIVIEGDLSTLYDVVEVLEKCIPVLILQGSGKAAEGCQGLPTTRY
jgi:hypothetical protein